MGQRPFIVLGDTTDHGGVVVGASQVTLTHNRPIARVGDQVTCPKKGHGTTVIVTGDPTMIIDGQPAARHGDKCACGATLISSQVVSTTGDGGGAGGAGQYANDHAVAVATRTDYASATSAEVPHDQHFELLNELTGAPLVGYRYRMTWAGQFVEGVTDKQGRTQRAEAAQKEAVKIEVFGRAS
jgi:uncharacterized Zn-binding protein involved in type VI secretion